MQSSKPGPSTWRTQEDFERDILLYAEVTTPTPEEIAKDKKKYAVPDTILRYTKQMEDNRKKTLNSDIDDNVTYVMSGRGRGIQDRVLRPGEGVVSHPSDEMELKKAIREAAGLGYSNDLVQQAIQSNHYDPGEFNDEIPCEIPEFSQLKLINLSSSSSSSARSTPVKSLKSPRISPTNDKSGI